MTVTLTHPLLVSAPPTSPRPHGLFSVAVPRGEADPHWRRGVAWQSAACGSARVTRDPCVDDTAGLPVINRACAPVALFAPFTVYHFDVLSTGGSTEAERLAEARDSLLHGEEQAAEQVLWGLLGAAVAETAVTAARGLRFGLGVVEARLAREYGGRGVIHMGRVAANLLIDQLKVSGAVLTTLLGTPVVAGGGYDTSETTATIYGSGPLVLYRGEIDARSVIDRRVNDVSALAQRDYVVGWDCTTVGVTVTL